MKAYHAYIWPPKLHQKPSKYSLDKMINITFKMSAHELPLTESQLETLNKYNLTKDELNNLYQRSTEALDLSYSPYSNFRVGCCVLTTDGVYIKGANIENASYGGAICAERSALCTSLNQQYRHFKALGITSDMTNEIITPCGICRQFIREFGKEIILVMFQSDGQEFMIRTLEEILPFSFGPEQLK